MIDTRHIICDTLYLVLIFCVTNITLLYLGLVESCGSNQVLYPMGWQHLFMGYSLHALHVPAMLWGRMASLGHFCAPGTEDNTYNKMPYMWRTQNDNFCTVLAFQRAVSKILILQPSGRVQYSDKRLHDLRLHYYRHCSHSSQKCPVTPKEEQTLQEDENCEKEMKYEHIK